MRRALLAAVLATAAVVAAAPKSAHAGGHRRPQAGPTPYDACFAQAGAYYKIHPLLLKAIARQESSMIASAVGNNTNGTQDLGLMQINSTHLPRLAAAGVTRQRLLTEPCTNIAVGAWLLADAIRRYGMSWTAVGTYHSPTEWRKQDYARKIAVHLLREIRAAQAMEAASEARPPATQDAALVTQGEATGG